MEQPTEQSTEQPKLLNHAAKWGAICAGISIFVSLALYLIDYTLMVQLKFLFISLAIYFGIIIYAGIEYRNLGNGYLAYGKAFQHGFLVLIISGLIGTVWNAVLYNIIDSELPEKLVEAAVENQREMMISFGAPESSIDEALEQAAERTRNQFTLAGQAFGLLFIAGFSAVMALLSAIFVRRNEPVEM